MAIRKILFCTDFSENSVSARHQAVEFAKALGAQLNILHVVDAGPLGYPIFEDRIPVDMVKLQEDIQSMDHCLCSAIVLQATPKSTGRWRGKCKKSL